MEQLDPSALVALDVLLETRSVTMSARRLGLSQPAMSHRLRQLREALGDPLLVGGRQGLVPTPRAAAMQGPLRRALADLRSAVRAGEAFDPATSTRKFVVASSDHGDFVAVPRAVTRVQSEAPGVTLESLVAGPDLGDKLASGEVDIAVTAPGNLPPSLRQQKVADFEYLVALRKGHPALSRRRSLSLDAYCALDHLLVAPRGLPGSLVDDALSALGRTRRIVLRMRHFAPAPFMVAQSDLITTLDESLLRTAAQHVALELVAPPLPLPTTPVVMVWHERAQVDPAHVWLREVVASSLSSTSARKRKGRAPRRGALR